MAMQVEMFLPWHKWKTLRPLLTAKTSYGSPDISQNTFRNLIRKACLADESFYNFFTRNGSDLRPLWNILTWGCTSRSHSLWSSRSSSKRRARRSGYHSFGNHNGATTITERLTEARTLDKTWQAEWMEGTHRHLDCPSDVGRYSTSKSCDLKLKTRKRVNRLMWGWSNTLHMSLNTRRRKDHVVRKLW